MKAAKRPNTGVVWALLLSNAVSLFLFLLRVVGAHNTRYYFLFWNLLLAWLPVLFAYLLIKRLKTELWRQPFPAILTLLWLFFLPNSFYLMSDLIHLQNTGEVGLLFDSVLFLSCIWNGLAAGFLSLFWVHRALITRRKLYTRYIIAAVLLLVSFAIYLGRNLRWNTWDILASPAGLLFDLSERLIHPFRYPQMFVITLAFFVLLSSMYLVVFNLADTLQPSKRR